MKISDTERAQFWPELPYAAWQPTAETLHLWTQVVGKVRLKLTPWLNHSWHVTLYLTARGLTTSPIAHGSDCFEIDFDFIDHLLLIRNSRGAVRTIKLRPMAVADFYRELMAALHEMKLEVKISAA